MKALKWAGWIITSLISGLILGGIFLGPWLETRSSALASLVYTLYSPFCHQHPLRSYYLAGRQLTVCSRCTGIYAGFFLSTLLYPFWWKRLKNWIEARPVLIVASALPMGLDVLLFILGLWNSPLFIKSLTGFIWSGWLPFFWFKALKELIRPAL
ncbi:MAG: DUF2085 domain-containing protein [Acidobacteriota bacterium]|nr:DUF2085 domain-containing protein [Acidobacteriota bacterium]